MKTKIPAKPIKIANSNLGKHTDKVTILTSKTLAEKAKDLDKKIQNKHDNLWQQICHEVRNLNNKTSEI